jgi:hypothetical protein
MYIHIILVHSKNDIKNHREHLSYLHKRYKTKAERHKFYLGRIRPWSIAPDPPNWPPHTPT